MPFPSYNTASPTPSTKNSLNQITVGFGIRDFLLRKNIINPIKYPYISTSINGSPKGGQPVLDTMVGSGVVHPQVSIEVDGIFRYDNATIMNRYKNDSSTAGELQGIETIPTNTSTFPNSTSANGVSDYPQNIIDTGILAKTQDREFRKKATIKNLYLDASKQLDVADYLSLQPIGPAQQLSNYVDTYGSMDSGSRTANVVGSILNGQGVGFDKSGLVANFDFKASLASRVLTATGFVHDTRLGVIGGQQLALALANNATFNVEQETLGHVNLNVVDLFRGGDFIKPDYSITVGSTTGGKILNYAEKLLGFELPKSRLDAAGSIFSTESGSISNIQRANSMLENTGKGQRRALTKQFRANMNGIGDGDNPNYSPFRSGYCPGYEFSNKFILNGNPNVYAFYDSKGQTNNFIGSVSEGNIIPVISYAKDIESYGFNGFDDVYGNGHSTINQPTFSWGSSPLENVGNGTSVQSNRVNANLASEPFIGKDKKSLLSKTQLLFNSFGMKSIVSTKGHMGAEASQIQTSVVKGAISKGSAVQSSMSIKGGGTTPDEIFCRAWTTFNRYGTVGNLIRHKGLNQNNSSDKVMDEKQWRLNTIGTVLDSNGFVKIGPYKDEKLERGDINVKQYMLSIENLAWAGSAQNLLPVEQGPGDLLSGKFGRIMWFPPYDINFTENNTANWDSTQFIGRGEPIYTYNNSERTGTLSFKVIVDHPSQMNTFAGSNGPADDEIASYFAGCSDISPSLLNKLTVDEANTIEKRIVTKVTKTVVDKQVAPPSFNVYFLNDRTDINTNYELTVGEGVGTYVTEPQTHNGKTRPARTLVDRKSFGLNGEKQPIVYDGVTYNGWTDVGFQAVMKTHLKDKCPSCRVDIYGYASTQGWKDTNQKLSEDRAKNFFTWFTANMLPTADVNGAKRKNYIAGKGELLGTGTNTNPTDAEFVKKGRKVTIKFVPDPTLSSDRFVSEQVEETVPTKPSKLNRSILKRYYNETSFFEKLTEQDPLVFDQIRQKIKYFHPAFHSTTPEGLNTRLTFLNQCTRQGPTLSANNPLNLAFGPPPVCILRIGDFYNTKIVMDNVDYSFEPLVWDLNPEGVGVQPMIANVNISFKFIGGSSLQSPINKLQNALSFNYYANTQVYDARADYIEAKINATDASKVDNYTLVAGANMAQGDVAVTETTTTPDNGTSKPKDQTNHAAASTDGIDNQEGVNVVTNDLDKIVINVIDVVFPTDKIRLVVNVSQALSKDYTFRTQLYNLDGSLIGELQGLEGASIITAAAGDKQFNYTGNIVNMVEKKGYTLALIIGSIPKRANFIA